MSERKRVLVVDANPDLRTIFMVSLQLDFDVYSASDGQVSIERIDEFAPDAIILDLNMPRVTGEEVLRYVRAKPECAHTRIMVVTGNYLAEHAPERELADMFFIKPVDALIKFVHRILKKNVGSLKLRAIRDVQTESVPNT